MDNPENRKKRYCLICQIFKPERCHHCSQCNTCILGFDHHCPWFGKCIGFSNRKQLILLLIYSFLNLLIVVSFNIIFTGRAIKSYILHGVNTILLSLILKLGLFQNVGCRYCRFHLYFHLFCVFNQLYAISFEFGNQ